MKHGKKLTRKQKIFLSSHGWNPSTWLCVKNTPESIEFVNTITGNGEIMRVDKKLVNF